jgi:hypothetical protein
VRQAETISLDFGSECAGWLEFDADDIPAGTTVSISEYNSPEEVNSGANHPEKTTTPIKIGRSWRAVFNRDGYEGIRFAWINIAQNPQRPWTLSNPRLVCRVKPVNYLGSFHSDSSMLNSIWYTGAYTARLNMLQDGFSALLMDRGDRISWTGDAYITQRAALGAFGASELVRKSLISTAGDSNGIEPYALLWVLSLVDWYQYSGDTDHFLELAPIAISKLEHGAEIWDNPNIAFYGHDERLGYLQSPAANLPEEKRAYRLLLIRSMTSLAEALASAGRSQNSAALTESATQLKQRFAESEKSYAAPLGVHATAEEILASVGSPAKQAADYAREFSDENQRLSFSPFNEFTLLEAMAKAGHRKEALNDLQALWGAQVTYGATCFAEVFRPSWASDLPRNARIPSGVAGYTSLCHGWSSGVVQWIHENVLGVRATSPGYRTVDIQPFIDNSLLRYEGVVPTPRGPIKVSVDVMRGEALIGVPNNTTARVIMLNQHGEPVTHLASSGTHSFLFRLNDVSNGQHAALETSTWPVTIARASVQPGGNWKGVLGTKGHVFFGLQDQMHPPEFVSTITTNSPETKVLTTCSDDTRALAIEKNKCRQLGALTTERPYWDKLTEFVDVVTKGTTSTNVSLYFVDWAGGDSALELTVFDRESLKLIAKPYILERYGNGVYLSFVATGSVRLRISHIHGNDASVSALFFD